jgi:hypothetical protein
MLLPLGRGSYIAKGVAAGCDPTRDAIGHVAEWLRNGLQNRGRRFNSGRGLHQLLDRGGDMRSIAILLGLLFLVIAVVYWVVPAESLPGFFPGFEPGLGRVRFKHGVVAAVVGVLLFAIGWYFGRRRSVF